MVVVYGTLMCTSIATQSICMLLVGVVVSKRIFTRRQPISAGRYRPLALSFRTPKILEKFQ